MTRTCRVCSAVKPDESFYRHRGGLRGRENICKQCSSTRDKGRQRPGRHPAKSVNRRTAEYRRRYPERERAKQAVREALRIGQLKRGPCERCGDVKVQAHHPDYSQPLSVVWLCPKHHIALHRGKDA